MCFKKVWRLMELGYARQVQIGLFTKGIISREEVLRKLDELDAQ